MEVLRKVRLKEETFNITVRGKAKENMIKTDETKSDSFLAFSSLLNLLCVCKRSDLRSFSFLYSIFGLELLFAIHKKEEESKGDPQKITLRDKAFNILSF